MNAGLNVRHVGIAGEVRFVVKKADGTVKNDTGFQKNLILNQGLDFFGGGKGSNIFASCVIGSGNSSPAPTQTQLDSFLAIAGGERSSTKYDYTPSADNLYKTNNVYKYTFTGLNNANVTEAGLVSEGNTSTNYYLCTRALMRDSSGSLTSITVLAGEILEVYYRLWRVVSTLDVNHVVNMLDGKGGSISYKCTVRPAQVAAQDTQVVGLPLTIPNGAGLFVGTGELLPITAMTTTTFVANTLSQINYEIGSYKKVWVFSLKISDSNVAIRTISTGGSNQSGWLCPFQMRFGSVASDAAIPKTNLQILSMPFEFSWGRYEGVL